MINYASRLNLLCIDLKESLNEARRLKRNASARMRYYNNLLPDNNIVDEIALNEAWAERDTLKDDIERGAKALKGLRKVLRGIYEL